MYLQILSINRPFNAASAKWEHIDFEKQIWTIPENETQTKMVHKILLTNSMIKILKEQYLFSGKISDFVFPARTIQGHINRDSIGKAMKNLGAKNKCRKKQVLTDLERLLELCVLNTKQSF